MWKINVIKKTFSSLQSSKPKLFKRDKTIYVGNLAWAASHSDVFRLFSEFGNVNSVKIMVDRQTGKSRGFCFVEMDDASAVKAVESLNGKPFMGRNLKLDYSHAPPRPQQTNNQSNPNNNNSQPQEHNN